MESVDAYFKASVSVFTTKRGGLARREELVPMARMSSNQDLSVVKDELAELPPDNDAEFVFGLDGKPSRLVDGQYYQAAYVSCSYDLETGLSDYDLVFRQLPASRVAELMARKDNVVADEQGDAGQRKISDMFPSNNDDHDDIILPADPVSPVPDMPDSGSHP